MKKTLFITGFVLLLLQTASPQQSLHVIDKKVNFGYKTTQNRTIDVIVVHSTFNNSGGEKYDADLVVKQFSDYGVSSHYLIGRNGTIYRLVDEKNVAYHAGVSALPNGRSGLNSCSIGIELITSFDESPTDEQINALVALVTDIKTRHKINYIVRHSDIAPGRKTDPWNMDWDKFLSLLKN